MVEIASDPELGSARSVGAELHAARESQQLALADIANRTRIPLRHLNAIEASDYESLPAATYSAGFVKTYARVLGLDGDACSRRFREEMAGRQAEAQRYEPYEPADPARTPTRWLAWSMLGVAVVLALIYVYWRGTLTDDNPAQVATQAQTAPLPAPVAAPAQPIAAQPAGATPAAAAPAATPELGAVTLITAEQPAWIRVTDGETKLFENMLKPGEHFEVPTTAIDPRLRTSRATALKVTVGSTVIPPLGPPETLIKNVSLLPKALLEAKPAGAPASATPATTTR